MFAGAGFEIFQKLFCEVVEFGLAPESLYRPTSSYIKSSTLISHLLMAAFHVCRIELRLVSIVNIIIS